MYRRYNVPFTVRELQAVIRDVGDTAAGPDDIPYSNIRRLAYSSMVTLLPLYTPYRPSEVSKVMEGGDRHPASECQKGSPLSRTLSSGILFTLSRKVIGDDGKQSGHLVSGKIRPSDRTPVWVQETPFYY